MSSGTPFDKFKELGCSLDSLKPEDVNWMLDEPSMKPFVEWFLANISADNVLSHGELEEYQRICDAGEELHGEALDNALREAGFSIDDPPIDAFDLLELKDEIKFLTSQAEVLTNVKEHLQSTLEREKQEELQRAKQIQDQQTVCFRDGQALMKLNVHMKHSLAHFYQGLENLTSMCLNYKNADTCHFLAQAPLEDVLSQCDTFEQHVKVFIKRQFERKEVSGKPNIEMLLLMLSDELDDKEESIVLKKDSNQSNFKVHPKILWEAEVRRLSAAAKRTAAEEALQYAKSLNAENSMLLLKRSDQDVSLLITEIELLVQHEVSTVAQNYVVAKIASIAEEFAQRKVERRRYRLGKLDILRDNVAWHVFLTDVLWMLLRREAKLVALAAEFIDESVATLTEEHSKHLAVMGLHQGIQQRHAAFLNAVKHGQIPLVNCLRRLMGLEETADILSVVDSIGKLLNHVEDVDLNGFLMESRKSDLAMEKSLRSFQEVLFSGPTREPLLIPADIVQKIGSVMTVIEELDAEVKRLERNFSSKQELFSKFPIQRDSRLLWAWFLASPAQLFAAMKKAEEAAKK